MFPEDSNVCPSPRRISDNRDNVKILDPENFGRYGIEFDLEISGGEQCVGSLDRVKLGERG